MSKFAIFAISFVTTFALLVFPGETLAKYAGFQWVNPSIPKQPRAINAGFRTTTTATQPTIMASPTPSGQATVTPKPTATPTLTPIKSGPTTKPHPTATLRPKPNPTPTQSSIPSFHSDDESSSERAGQTTIITSSDSKKTYMMQAINDYRKSKGLSEVHMDGYTCNFAKVRAGEIAQNFNHDGFQNRIHTNTLPYPSYSEITENIAMNSDYKDVVTQWINSAGHRENIEKDTPYVCVEYSGNYYAYEGWKP